MRLVPLAVLAALVSGTALAADFSGTWNISSKVGDNPVSIVCALAQKGDALTGTCKPAQFDPSDTKGTVSGSSAKWGYDVVFNGNQNHVEYEATLGADGTLTGTLHLGPMPTPFTATRQ
jgi:opacity protein-like surface antigen